MLTRVVQSILTKSVLMLFMLLGHTLAGSALGAVPITDPALAAHWALNETSGAIARDSSVNANNGTVTGAIWATGQVAGALEFRNSTDRVAVPNSPSLGLSGNRFTIACWVYPTNVTSAWSTVLQRSNTAGSWIAWQLYARASDAPTAFRPVFRVNWDNDTANDADEEVQGDIALAVNTWYHIACTYDGAAMRFYINGTLRGTTAKSGGVVPSSSKPLWVGANDAWGEPFAGRVDDVRLYDSALTQAQIQNLINQVNKATLAVNVTGSGSVTKNPDLTQYNYGDSVQLTAIPASGQAFTGWSGDLTGSANPATLVMNGSKTVTALFEVIQPPAITRQPVDIAVRTGQRAIFSVATSGTPPLTYQWQKLSDTIWSNVGTPGATCLTNPVTLGDNGAKYRCVVSSLYGSVTSNEATLTVSESAGNGFWEDFESGFTLGQVVGAHADWFDAGAGPQVQAGIGATASRGLAPGNDIFTWTAHPFNWGTPNFIAVILQMDFQSNASGEFDDDRVGWMTSATSADSTNCFGVQLDTVTDGGIVTFWRTAAGTRIQTPIVPFTSVKANTWYTLQAVITKLTATSASIDVSLTELDAAGQPVGTPLTGRLADTSQWSAGAPPAQYFTATTLWPAYKNYTGISGAADNAYAGFIAGTGTYYTLTSGASGSGTVACNPDKPYYSAGESVQITATPASGWIFAGWSGNLTGSANPATIAMDANKTVTATFQPIGVGGALETFNNGFTLGQAVGAHADWFDDGSGGPQVQSAIGVGGSAGLAPGSSIFTWTAHPFTWSDDALAGIILAMDFQSNASGEFDDDRVGWMTSATSADSTNCFGVQLDTVTDGGIVTYWRTAAGTRIQTPIVPFTSVKASTWYNLRVSITKLTATSASIDVSLTELDAAGQPVGTPLTGTLADTSQWAAGAPPASYFNAASLWPAYKNHSAITGAADNAYFEVVKAVPGGDSFAFAVITDPHTSNSPTGFEAGLQQIKLWLDQPTSEMPAPAFLIITGDFPYATATDASIDRVLGTNFVWYPAVGNHEGDDPTNFAYVRDTYLPTLPWVVSSGPNGSLRTNYSWDYGNAHFVAINAYWNGATTTGSDYATDGDIVPALRNWISADLATSSRAHKFVLVHEPPYPEVRHMGDALDAHPANRDAFVSMLDAQGVEALFVGHDHYQHHDTSAEYPLLGRVHQLAGGQLLGPGAGGDGSTATYVMINGALTTYKIYRSTNGVPFNLASTWTVGPTPIQYSLTANASGNGTVAKSPDKAAYNAGEAVQLTATPDSGWSFAGWAGDLTSTVNPASLTMNGNKTVTATFIPAQYGLTLTLVGNGAVTKNPDKSGYDAGETVQLTAAPDPGWLFAGWSGDMTGDTNPTSLAMDGNKSVAATFVAVPVAPLITTPPANQTVNAGEAAGFTVAVTGTAPLTYLWQRMNPGGAWTDLSDTNNPTYTLPSTETGDDGVRFRCVVTNSVGSVTSDEAVLTVIASAPNNAIDFGGTNAYVTFGNNSALGLATFTLECWFRRDGTGVVTSTGTGGVTSAVPLVAKGRGESDGSNVDMNYFLGIRTTDNVLVADFEEGATGTTPGLNHPVAGVTAIQNNVWYHVAVSYDGAKWQLFLNGELERELSVGQPPRADSIQHASLASALTSTGVAAGFFNGVLDEVRIWDRARTQAEIRAMINSQIGAAQPGLVARWGLNEGVGTTVANAAGTTINGTITGTDHAWAGGAPFNLVINNPPDAPTLLAPPDQATDLTPPATLSVSVSDPDANVMNVVFYGRPITAPGADFTLAVLPDSQFYTAGTNGGTPAMFTAQTQWIVDHRAEANIAYVAHLGDIVNDGDTNATEWGNASNAMYLLESPAPGIPYGLVVGNHEQTPASDPAGTTTYFNQYFGASHFAGRAYYGGHYGTNNDNNYQLFSASGLDFIAINLEYDSTPDTPVLDWADTLLKTFAGRRAIVASHQLIGTGNPGAFATNGQTIYDSLKDNPNLFLMLCGHTSGEGQRADTFGSGTVYTLLSDYQSRTNGGSGWMRLLGFSPTTNQITVKTYSPTLDQYETDADSQFTLTYNMQAAPFQRLGTQPGVASGDTASCDWPGLASQTAYEWYVAIGDGKTTTTSPTWRFTSGGGLPASYTLTTDVSGNGALARTPDKAQYSAGESVLLAATPTTGWVFSGWSGDLSGSANPATLVMNGDKTVQATFIPAPPPDTQETFNSGFTLGQVVGNHADWYDGGSGPQVQATIGVGGSAGLAPAANIFTWNAHPFNWNAANFAGVILAMDFQSNASGQFDDDRLGWMTNASSTDSANNFGVQLDTVTDGGIATYWRTAAGTRIQAPIVPFTSVKASTWYNLRVSITKLTATSASIDVSLTELDAAGQPVGTPLTGTLADTSQWAAGAPAASYFNAASLWPAYKNYNAITGAADNAYCEVITTP